MPFGGHNPGSGISGDTNSCVNSYLVFFALLGRGDRYCRWLSYLWQGVLLIHSHRSYYYRTSSRPLVERFSVEWVRVSLSGGLESIYYRVNVPI